MPCSSDDFGQECGSWASSFPDRQQFPKLSKLCIKASSNTEFLKLPLNYCSYAKNREEQQNMIANEKSLNEQDR